MAAANVKLTIAYDGTAYDGWQRQRDRPTIQESLEVALGRMLGHRVVVHGAGRTDAGVHALGMVANFQPERSLPLEAYRRGLNSMLPPDIRILAAEEVEPGFHARFSARGKAYLYFFTTAAVMPPCRRLYCAHFPGAFDLEATRAALPQLIGEHDFSSFEAAGSRTRAGDEKAERGRGAVRCLTRLTLERDETGWGFAVGQSQAGGASYRLLVAGDGFLRHMVRNIAGTLIEVGRGRRRPESLGELLALGDRAQAGPTAPACGLTLWQVYY
ncbi:MAG TPA: tRNA pseudouridine(38-40) synthase TruA [Desulfurivibrio alkaliphilus]|uniref:tRNA pseudouridine synthase A n=1 Tax=Desulfurivibrio alkaliphilus TaxID=427923 RepID=A0A7C2TGR4_9BACT|nr:tRNA pseudouridine(38-40) synthase TruA [Desulfurivibrio alkaliphilus]